MLRQAIAVILLAFAVPMGLGTAEMAVPGIDIIVPADGTVLSDHATQISGTSSDAIETWLQTSQADFDLGSKDGVGSTPDGSLTINYTYDDFGDGELNASRWSVVDYPGMNVTEGGGALHMNGTALTGMMYDYAYTAEAVSEKGDLTWVSANLTSLTGTGSGYCAMMMVGTTRNHVSITIFNDSWGLRARVNMEVDGTSIGRIVDLSATAPHLLRIYTYNEFWMAGIDGEMVYAALDVSVDTGFLHLSASPRAYRDTVEAMWDDVMTFPTSANYTSAVHDTGAPSSTLENVRWNVTQPWGTSVLVSARSASREDMSDAGPWAVLWNDSYAGAMDRYVQYRAELTRPQIGDGPSLHDISFEFHLPLVRVEVSTDGSNWTLADGTGDWTAAVELPENRSVIWARVTDVRGSVAVTSVTVDVDTTPPSGTVLIDGGAEATGTQAVHLDLVAWDAYCVTDMKLGESPDLLAAPWTPFCATWEWTLSSGDGLKTVYAQFRDANGWLSEVAGDSIVLDTVPPMGSLLINGGNAYARSTSIDVSLTAIDAMGVVEMLVWNDEDVGGASWRPFTTVLGWDLSPGSGTKRVSAILRDRAGHNSAIVSDTIVLDLEPPMVDLSIDGGAPFTNGTLLEVILNATDANGLADMQLSEDPSFAGAEWVPFRAANDWQSSAVEGARTVHARVRDPAGNEGTASATIVLDLTPPVCTIDPLPSAVDTVRFNVSWSVADARSGIRDIDIQFKPGDGPWQDWLLGTELTNATFTGTYDRSYSFRVRATDKAGNAGAFPASGAGPVLVRPRPAETGDPWVAILRPADGSTVEGTVPVEGNASHETVGKHIVAVLVQVDGGDWKTAVGTTDWTFALDTRGLANGPHTIKARSTDGAKNSTVSTITVDVENGGGGTHEEGLTTPTKIIILILILAVVVAIALIARARTKGRRGGPPPKMMA